jgi:hypothetical protein
MSDKCAAISVCVDGPIKRKQSRMRAQMEAAIPDIEWAAATDVEGSVLRWCSCGS